MPQPVDSKRALIAEIERVVETQSVARMLELFDAIRRSDTRLWTDGAAAGRSTVQEKPTQ